MSFKAIFEFILQIHDFTNVDIPFQGYLYLRASLFSRNSEKYKIPQDYAIPFSLKADEGSQPYNKRKIIHGQFCQDHYFYSKTATIKYSDEKIVLNDKIRFKLQLQAFPTLNTDEVYLSFDLFFSSQYGSALNSKQPLKSTMVDSATFQLHNIEHGIFNYCEGEFLKTHVSKFSFTLFGCLSNFQFGKYQIRKKQSFVKDKDRSRNKVEAFEEFLGWCEKNYAQIDNGLEYFYRTYVKNLRYYFYLSQDKVNNNSLVKKEIVLKVPKEFNESQKIDEKIFKTYMLQYSPKQVTKGSLLKQINEVCMDIFFFIQEVEKDFCFDQFMCNNMKKQYEFYKKDKFGERVFKSIVYGKNNVLSSRQNKRIAKKMREKQLISSGDPYPIDDPVSFIRDQKFMQFVFYEVTYPSQQKPDQKIINKQFKEEKEKEEMIEYKKESEKRQYIQSKIVLKEENEEKQEEVQPKKEQNQYADLIEEEEEEGDDRFELDPQKSSDDGEFQYYKEDFTLPEIDYDEKQMLIVMCHGFQGSSYDMMIIYRYLKEKLPLASFLISRSNEGQTEGTIEEMGERVGNQVKNYIRNYLDEDNVIVNFIGHSMGGIIARASLKHLKKYETRFGFYCSLSSPHLSYLNGVGGMIQAGLWFLRTFKTIQSLKQLEMEEKKNPRETFLYRLSKEGSLKRFRKIILWSSFEDSYVPWHSARISLHHSKTDSKLGKVEKEMVENILGECAVHRLDVNFNILEKNIDSIIGRTAHINLIVQESLFKIVSYTIPKLYDIRDP